MKKLALPFRITILVCVVLFSVLPVFAAPVKLVVAHNQTSQENPYQYGMLKFKEAVERLSGGEFSVDVHAGTIGTNEDELVEKIQLGAADIVVASPGFMTKIGIPEVDMFSLLYLFSGFGHWEKVVDGAPGANLAKVINEKSRNTFRIAAYWSAGVRNYYGKKPIEKMADLSGMKIRTQMSGVVAEFWKKTGAIPTQVAWGELYQALQQGIVDAAENDYTNFSLLDHHKTVNGKFITETEHDYTTRVVLMNGKKWDSYSAQQKAWIDEALKEATAEERKVTYEQLDKSKARVLADGAKVNTIDKTPFAAIAVPIQDELAKRLGMEDFLKSIRDLGQ
ncbi:MAG: TRAP transporter substrate-binding protein [Synergistaceae bacterium]|jgi:tripartite ATP-independent transporter DctP family solute receptor|nr:TRAP transporter substrate-binding protein [Synergistaceae bacterium]